MQIIVNEPDLIRSGNTHGAGGEERTPQLTLDEICD